MHKSFTRNNLRNTTEVIIDMVDEAVRNEVRTYKRIKNKKILRINFDDFATNTDYQIKKICKFLNLRRTSFTKKIMKRERLPRLIDKSEREEKLGKIKNKVGIKKFKKLLDLEKFYNNN